MPQTDNNEAFLFVTPCSRRLILLLPERHTLLQFLTFFDGSPYLVLLGGKLTVLGHSLEKYESSALFVRRPPTRKIITFLIAYRQPPPPKQKNTENSNSLFQSLQNFRKLRTLNQIPNFFNLGKNLFDFGISLLFKDKDYYSKTKRKELQTVHQYIPKLLNKLLVSKITNPGRVKLARKLS